jgi:hypothetical protein
MTRWESCKLAGSERQRSGMDPHFCAGFGVEPSKMQVQLAPETARGFGMDLAQPDEIKE